MLQRQLGRQHDQRQIAHPASCEVASRSSRMTSSNSFPEELQQRRGRDIWLTLEGRQGFRLIEEDDDDYWDYLN